MKRGFFLGAALACVVVAPALAQTTETTVVTKKPSGGAAAGAATGAATGAVVGGPVGAVVGAVAGAVVGHSVDPPKEVRTYVTTQNVAPVTYGGPIVVGKPVTGVTWLDVPNYPKYRWAYLDGRRVVIDRASGNVVAVYSAAPPAAVHTYVMGQSPKVVTYGQPLVVGGTVTTDTTWLDVPDYPAYRWAYLDGHRVVVDAATNTIVSID